MDRRIMKGKTTKINGRLPKTSIALPKVKTFSKIKTTSNNNNSHAEEEDKDEELDEIDRLIASRAQQHQCFSKSLVETYTPLTKRQKITVYKDMNEISTIRFMEYNNIFDQIKRQITDINNNLSESIIENNNKERPIERKVKLRKTVSFKLADPIKGKEENTYHYSNIEVPTFTFDPDTLDERVNRIILRNCPIKDNSELLMSTKSKGNNGTSSEMTSPRDTDKSSFLEAKNEYKRIRDLFNQKKMKPLYKNKSKLDLNSKEFYYEPILTQQVNDDRKSTNVKYCNCPIF